jgi:hypothetical protein
MLTTEAEAKTKRCQEGYAASPGAAKEPVTEYTTAHQAVPMMSAAGAGGFAMTSTVSPMTAPIFCLGSACMAWRWRHEPRPDRDGQGYCGKAGPA